MPGGGAMIRGKEMSSGKRCSHKQGCFYREEWSSKLS